MIQKLKMYGPVGVIGLIGSQVKLPAYAPFISPRNVSSQEKQTKGLD
jgi:hypothetical protein